MALYLRKKGFGLSEETWTILGYTVLSVNQETKSLPGNLTEVSSQKGDKRYENA